MWEVRGTLLWVQLLWECWLVLLCLPVGGVGGGGEPAEWLVWSVGIVLGLPVFEHDLGFEQAGEFLDVEAFVSQAAVERLHEGVLPRASRARCRWCGCPACGTSRAEPTL